MMSSSGTDFIRKIDVFPKQLLDGDIKLVCQYDISPSSFPNTRLELLANTYQLYRFIKVKITYSSLLPTAINGLFIGFIDTDPEDKSVLDSVQTSNDVLRIARSHQGSVQGKIRDDWSFTMPIRDDDQFFFIGDGTRDRRLKKMGTLYIYQVGQATKFDGTPLTEELSAGALNIDWSCQFMNPQLQSLTRVYDGITEKDVYRTINDISWYRAFTKTSTPFEVFQNTRFRYMTWTLGQGLFSEPGDYVVLSIPTKFAISRAVKSINSFALPYSSWLGTPYGMTTSEAVLQGKILLKDFNNFLQEAFKFGRGAINVAREVYDVISLISTVFLLDAPDAQDLVNIDDPKDPDIQHSGENLPLGQNIIHYDGVNAPHIEDYIEFQDHAHARSSNHNMTITKLFIAFKIKRESNDTSAPIVEPNVPHLPKIDNS